MQNREQVMTDIVFNLILPKLSTEMAVSYLYDVVNPFGVNVENYYWMDYLNDKGYDIPTMFHLDDYTTGGYKRHINNKAKSN